LLLKFLPDLNFKEIKETLLKSFKLWIDFGALGTKKSSAQITQIYTQDELIGQYVLAVVNLPPGQVADFLSEVLVLGVVLENEEAALIQPDRAVELGKRVL
jgi:tRNA-binding protein